MRGGDLSCGGSSSGKLVGDAAFLPRAGRLASEGLDEDLHAFPETQHQVKGRLLLDVVVSKGMTILELLASKTIDSTSRVVVLPLFKEDNLVVKGGPNLGPRQSLMSTKPPVAASMLGRKKGRQTRALGSLLTHRPHISLHTELWRSVSQPLRE
jgi:hypothetical protein